MNLRFPIVGLVFCALLLIFLAGCTKRENPAVPEVAEKGLVTRGNHQYDGITGSAAIWNTFPSRWIRVYTPPGYDFELVGPRFPTLYLLPGYDGEPSFFYRFGNENYYMVSAINAVADRLIAEGAIKPMFIVMPDASIYYGGSFYANNSLAGKWEDMMSLELVNFIDGTGHPPGSGFRTLVDKESRAIGGHSSGGYGAVRIAMKHPDLFNSVSAIDAPLAFEHGNMTGLFAAYLTESGITSEQLYFDTDTTGFRNKPYMTVLYSMAATFSPAPFSEANNFSRLRIALPFDYQGAIVQSVWNQWLENDLYSWLDNSGYRAALANQNLHFEYSDHDMNLFHLQTQAFVSRLATLGIDHRAVSFKKYGGADARSRTFLNDRLAEILKFHNRHLKDREGNF